MSRALARHLEHARDPQWTFAPSDVIGMRKLLNDWAPSVIEWQKRRYKPAQLAEGGDGYADLADERATQCLQLLDTLERIPHAITPEFAAKGFRWFSAMRMPKSNQWRDTKLTRQFDARKRAIVDGFERFEFVGFENNGGQWYYPVYRVYGFVGKWPASLDHFEYCYGSWQAGNGVTFPREPVTLEPGKTYHVDVSACPHCIWAPEHYRNNGKCRCNDPNAKVMRTWGYRWNKAKGMWT